MHSIKIARIKSQPFGLSTNSNGSQLLEYKQYRSITFVHGCWYSDEKQYNHDLENILCSLSIGPQAGNKWALTITLSLMSNCDSNVWIDFIDLKQYDFPAFPALFHKMFCHICKSQNHFLWWLFKFEDATNSKVAVSFGRVCVQGPQLSYSSKLWIRTLNRRIVP